MKNLLKLYKDFKAKYE